MSTEIADTKWLAVSTDEYAVLQRIAGAAECVVKSKATTLYEYERIVKALAVVLSDYGREEVK